MILVSLRKVKQVLLRKFNTNPRSGISGFECSGSPESPASSHRTLRDNAVCWVVTELKLSVLEFDDVRNADAHSVSNNLLR